MIIRKTEICDLDSVMPIFDEARATIRALGIDQWQNGYPSREVIEQDVALLQSRVVVTDGGICTAHGTIGGQVCATFALIFDGEPTYNKIYDGKWKSNDEYAVIHRVAVKYNGRGLADKIYAYCYSLHPNLRIDTHRDNIPMQRSLTKNGFEYCGVIYIDDGSERLAYQKYKNS
jgi:hypothetical protein